MSTDFWTVLQNFERISALKPSVETEKNAWLDGPLVSFRIWSREDDIKDTTWDRFTGMRWWEGGKGESSIFFFPGAVHLTIIPSVFFLSLDSVWRGFDFQHKRTPMTWPRQKWRSEACVDPSLILNKWQQIYFKLETLQNRWPVEFMNLKNAGGGCCCTYVQSASYSYSCTEPLTVYELQSGQSYHTLIMDWLLLLNPVLTRLTCNSCQPSTKCTSWIERTHT